MGRVVLRIVARAWVISPEDVVVGASIGVARSVEVFGVGIRGSNVEMRVSIVWRGRSGCHDSIYHK